MEKVKLVAEQIVRQVKSNCDRFDNKQKIDAHNTKVSALTTLNAVIQHNLTIEECKAVRDVLADMEILESKADFEG